MIEWINQVLSLARARGFAVRWEMRLSPSDPFVGVFIFTCPNGGGGYAGAGSQMMHLTTPEVFIRYWGTCSASTPAGVTASLQTREHKPGWYIPWRNAKAAYNAMEALFS